MRRRVVVVAALVTLSACSGHARPAAQASAQAASASAAAAKPVDPDALPIAELSTTAPVPTAALVAQTLTTPLADAALGDQTKLHALVVDALTGQVLLDRNGDAPAVPASTVKLATAVAALKTFAPTDTFTTKVEAAAQPAPDGTLTGDLVLVGAGDMTLTAGGGTGYADLHPVTLASLAAAVKAAGVTTVTGRVLGDGNLFTGPRTAEGWKPTYSSQGSVAPVTALEVDAGRPGPPVDRDTRPRAAAPDAQAATLFRAALLAAGVTVKGGAATGAAPDGAVTLASGTSPTVPALVQRMLTNSDDDIAEALGRLVALKTGQQPTFDGAGAAVGSVVGGLAAGSGTGTTLHDTSGLSPADLVTPSLLVSLLRLAVGPGQPELRPVSTGLAVSGISGTLVKRYLDAATMPAAGKVHAKTGTLAGVTALAGWTTDAQGRLLLVDVTADASLGEAAAQHAVDVAFTALTALTVPIPADTGTPSASGSPS